MDTAPNSMFEKMAVSVWGLPIWVRTALCILFVGLPFAIALLEGSLTELLQSGQWRRVLVAPVIIIYTIGITPPLFRLRREVVIGFRSISQLDDEAFDRLVDHSSEISARNEWMAIGVGVVIGAILSPSVRLVTQPTVLRLFVAFSILAMYGTLAWIIFGSLADARRMATLNHHPLDIDIFDLTPFEPIGRQSLAISLAFVGGTTISLLLLFSREDFLTWQNLVLYSILIVVIVLLFFVNMWGTHRVLSQTKQNALANARSSYCRCLSRAGETDGEARGHAGHRR